MFLGFENDTYPPFLSEVSEKPEMRGGAERNIISTTEGSGNKKYPCGENPRRTQVYGEDSSDSAGKAGWGISGSSADRSEGIGSALGLRNHRRADILSCGEAGVCKERGVEDDGVELAHERDE